MVIPIGGCDNVEWGGVDVAVVPPPPKADATEGTELEAAEQLPENPILYYVTRDSGGATAVPVGEVSDEGLDPIEPGENPEQFGSRFVAAYLRQGSELTLFHRGRRAGTLIVDSATVPTEGVCRPLPRALGNLELSGNVGGAAEFLAMARTQAPEGRTDGDTLQEARRMQVVGNILAERTLRARGAQLPNWSTARRQLFPFPVAETEDAGFTATFLVDDELQIGNDDLGYSLFIVYTPQAQTGYDTAYVDYTSYTAAGKAAPRAIDFLDWDRDGSAEILLEVFGTENRWFEAVGQQDGEWQQVFEDRCDPGARMAAEPVTTDTAAAAPASQPTAPRPTQQPAQQPPAGATTQSPPPDTTPGGG